MHKLEVKSFFSSDVDTSIYHWQPDDPEVVFIQLSIAIGVEGEEASDDYQTVVATPKGIEEAMTAHNVKSFDRNLMVYKFYSFDQVKEDIETIAANCQCDTYEESTLKLQRYFLWEYEDYVLSD